MCFTKLPNKGNPESVPKLLENSLYKNLETDEKNLQQAEDGLKPRRSRIRLINISGVSYKES